MTLQREGVEEDLGSFPSPNKLNNFAVAKTNEYTNNNELLIPLITERAKMLKASQTNQTSNTSV